MTANVEHEGGIPGEAPREPLRGGAQVLCDDIIAMMMFLRVVVSESITTSKMSGR